MSSHRPSCPNPKSLISRVAASAAKNDPYTKGAAAPLDSKNPYPRNSEEAGLWALGNQDEEARLIVLEEGL